MRHITFLGIFVALVAIACGNGDIGEDCDEEGHVGGECVSGAVCGRKDTPTSGDLVCLKQCSSFADCGAGETCSAVSGTSLRGCRATRP